MSSDSISITRPDDWHIHLRDATALQTTVPHAARVFGRAIVMPNLNPPVTSAVEALRYRERILLAVPEGCAFKPLMTLYLTDTLLVKEITKIENEDSILAVKLSLIHI